MFASEVQKSLEESRKAFADIGALQEVVLNKHSAGGTIPRKTLVLAAIPLPLSYSGSYWNLCIEDDDRYDDPGYTSPFKFVMLHIHLPGGGGFHEREEALEAIRRQIRAAHEALPDMGAALRQDLAQYNAKTLAGRVHELEKLRTKVSEMQREELRLQEYQASEYRQFMWHLKNPR